MNDAHERSFSGHEWSWGGVERSFSSHELQRGRAVAEQSIRAVADRQPMRAVAEASAMRQAPRMRNPIPHVVAALAAVALAPLAVVIPHAAFAQAEVAAPRLVLPSWSDGLAEVAGYASVVPKYGTPREAEEILITVEEDQDRDTLVKALPDAPRAQRRRVVKLNRELSLPTGIYTYRQMSSAFVDAETLAVTKIAASSQEWCGTTFVEAVARDGSLTVRTFSYFEGEGDRTFELAWPDGAWAADALPVLARALPRDAAGELVAVPFLPSVLGNRVTEPVLGEATITWSAPREDGGRSVQDVTVVLGGGERHALVLEAAEPRRVLSWEHPGGARAELTGSERLAYWRMSSPGDEARREALLGD